MEKIGSFLVPTLRVGTDAPDALRLCKKQQQAMVPFQDTERPSLRSHAERGNEENGKNLTCGIGVAKN